jgi:hypothetical protein
MEEDMEIYILNDYSVAQSDYNNKLYRVTARDLTDGRSDTGGWGSETAKIGNYIQATYSLRHISHFVRRIYTILGESYQSKIRKNGFRIFFRWKNVVKGDYSIQTHVVMGVREGKN